MTQWRHLFSLEVFLENGYMVLNGLKTSSNSYGKEVLTIVKNRSAAPSATWNKEINKKYVVDDSFFSEIKHFLGIIKNKLPVETSNSQEAYEIMKIIDRIYEQ